MKRVYVFVGLILALAVTVANVDAGCRSRASARRGGISILRSGPPRVIRSHPTPVPPSTARKLPFMPYVN